MTQVDIQNIVPGAMVRVKPRSWKNDQTILAVVERVSGDNGDSYVHVITSAGDRQWGMRWVKPRAKYLFSEIVEIVDCSVEGHGGEVDIANIVPGTMVSVRHYLHHMEPPTALARVDVVHEIGFVELTLSREIRQRLLVSERSDPMEYLVAEIVGIVEQPSVEQWTRFFWGMDYWHHIVGPKADWTPNSPCMFRVHDDGPVPPRSVMRGVVNVWGNVHGVDMCTECAHAFHGKISDMIYLSERK